MIACIQMVPILEFEPCDWAPDGYSDILGTDEWPSYWGRALDALGLAPLWPGSWFVPVERIHEYSLLDRIVRREIEGSGIVGFPDDAGDTDEDEERLIALTGGFALVAEGEVLLEPGCCGGLQDLDVWRNALSQVREDWATLSIGHATTSIRLETDTVVIRDVAESFPHPSTVIRVLRSAFEAAVPEAEAVLAAFEERLVPVVAELLGDRNRGLRVAKILSGTLYGGESETPPEVS